MIYSEVRGFNYQPSYGSTSFENWINFDPEIIELELRRGKEFFPVMNTVRLWLSWAAFVRNPQKFMADFEKALAICDRVKVCSQILRASPKKEKTVLNFKYYV